MEYRALALTFVHVNKFTYRIGEYLLKCFDDFCSFFCCHISLMARFKIEFVINDICWFSSTVVMGNTLEKTTLD
jgi:hypothetical protein